MESPPVGRIVVAVNTLSRWNRDAGFDGRVRLAVIPMTYTELPEPVVTKSIPLDARLVRGSHGAPARDDAQRGVMLSSERGVLVGRSLADTDVYDLVLRQFGI